MTTATSVVNVGKGGEIFTLKMGNEDGYDGSIREWAMNAKTADDTYLFHSVEEGRRGQCYFLHEETRKEEAEQWLDRCFNGILQEHGVDACKRILGGKHTCAWKIRCRTPLK